MISNYSCCQWCCKVHPQIPKTARIGSWIAVKCSVARCGMLWRLMLKTTLKQFFYPVHDIWRNLVCRVPIVIANDPDDDDSITTVYWRKTRREIHRISGITHDPKTGARFYMSGRTLKTFID